MRISVSTSACGPQKALVQKPGLAKTTTVGSSLATASATVSV